MVKVFISYRHETDVSHQARVKELGERLIEANLDVALDQFYLDANPGGPDEQWPKWCENQVPSADKVLIVASAGYFRCYEQEELPGVGLGAACETTTIRNALYQAGYKTDKFRIVYFEKLHLEKIPSSISGIHRFNALDSQELAELIAWLGGTVTAKIDPTNAPSGVKWPAPLSGYEPDLANRTEEFQAFSSMLAGGTEFRAVFFQAPTDHGKTTLVRECMHYARALLGVDACLTIDLKGNPTKDTVFEKLSLSLSKHLKKFSRTGAATRDLRLDLMHLSHPVVLLLDTYEQAGGEMRDIVQNLLLADLDRTPALRIVVAGQVVPDSTKAIWAPIVRNFALGPIADSRHWKRYASRHHPKLTSEQIETLTDAVSGHPGYLKTMLVTLAQKR